MLNGTAFALARGRFDVLYKTFSVFTLYGAGEKTPTGENLPAKDNRQRGILLLYSLNFSCHCPSTYTRYTVHGTHSRSRMWGAIGELIITVAFFFAKGLIPSLEVLYSAIINNFPDKLAHFEYGEFKMKLKYQRIVRNGVINDPFRMCIIFFLLLSADRRHYKCIV